MYGVIGRSNVVIETLRNKFPALCFAYVFCRPYGMYNTICDYQFFMKCTKVVYISKRGLPSSSITSVMLLS